MAVDDVCNVNGSPLFAQFAFEDWVLLNLRAELHLMANAFAKDAADPERVGIHDQHLAFYYQKYFKKQLVPKHFSTETTAELVEKLLKDTLSYDSDLVLVAKHGEELSDFGLLVKLTEAARRERQAKIDSGDETVKLRFEQQTMPPPPPQQVLGGYKGDFKGGYKGDKGGYDKGYNKGFNKGFGKDGKKGFDKGKKGDKGFGKNKGFKGY